MPFDITTAKPVKTSFDITTAKPQTPIANNPDVPGGGQVSIAAPKESSFIEDVTGIGEAVLTTATGATTGAIGFGLGTIEGAGKELIGSIPRGEGLKIAGKYAEALTYLPKTQEGQDIVKFIGEKLSVLPPVMGATPLTVVKAPFTAGQNARLSVSATKAKLGDLVVPIGMAKSAFKRGNQKNMRIPKDNGLKRKLLSEQTLAENPNIDAVTKMINSEGNIVTNQNSKLALKKLTKTLGEEKAVQTVSVVENMNQETKAMASKMLDNINKSRQEPLSINDNLPSNIVGDAMGIRVQDIFNLNDKAGKGITRAVKRDLEGNNYNVSNARNRFYGDLIKKGADIIEDPETKVLSVDFSKSKILGGDKAEITKLVNFMKDGKMDGADIHETKQFTQSLVSYGDQATALEAKSQIPFKNLADDLNGILRKASPDYKKNNEIFSDSIEIKRKFEKILKGIDIDDVLSGESLANKTRRLSSNAESKTPIKALIRDAEATMKKHTDKIYRENINALNHLLTDLENDFKIAPANSLQGVTQRGMVNVMDGLSPEMAVTRGLMDKVFRASEPDFNSKMKAYRLLTEQGNK